MRRLRLPPECWAWLVGAMLLLGMPLASAQQGLPDTLLWEPIGELQQGTWLAFDNDTLYAGVGHITGQELSSIAVLYPETTRWVAAVETSMWAQDMVFMPNGTLFFYRTSLLGRSEGRLEDAVEVHDQTRFMLPIQTPDGTLLVGINDGPFVATRSTDDGLTWTDHGGPEVSVSGMSPIDLLVLPPTMERRTSRIVAVGYGGILFSDDDGRTWHPSDVYAEGPAFTAWAGVRIASGSYDGSQGGKLLAVIEGSGGSSLMARSSDGIEWEAVAPFPGQARSSSDLLAMPDGTVFLYEGSGDNNNRDGRTLWRTADGGSTWQAVGPVWRGWSAVPTDLAIGPDGRLWASAEGASGGSKRGGVFRTVEPVYVATEEPLTGIFPGGRLAAHPNPARQHVTLEPKVGVSQLAGSDHQIVEIVVTDSTGREVARTERVPGSRWRLDVSDWAPGVYHAWIEGERPRDAVAFTVVR